MILDLHSCLEDKQIAENLGKPYYEYIDFSDVVVEKPWGHEFACVIGPSYSAWILEIEAGKTSSFHLHPTKKTTLVILSGSIKLHLVNNRILFLKPDDVAIINPGVLHRVENNNSDGNTCLLEIEDSIYKTDLVRYSDAYNRVGKNYEKKFKPVAGYKNYFLYKDEPCLEKTLYKTTLRIGPEAVTRTCNTNQPCICLPVYKNIFITISHPSTASYN